MKKLKSKGKWGYCILVVLGILMIIAIAIWLKHGVKIKADFDRLQSEDYDTLFISMYPIHYYDEADYAYYRGLDCVKMEYPIAHGKIAKWYMHTAMKSGNNITRVYLGIDPEHASEDDIVQLIQAYPNILFDVILPYPQMEYWIEKSDTEFDKIIKKYQILSEGLLTLANVDLYYFGSEEWLIANPENYEDAHLVNESVSEFLMCNTDAQHPYEMTSANVQVKYEELRELVQQYKNSPIAYSNAENVEIVFFGDSIIGNYTNSLSIPEIVKGLSGATVYNCGYGGCSAAKREGELGDFVKIVEAFLNGETGDLPEDKPVYTGIRQFREREVSGKQVMFVINFALNDYYAGVPVKSEDNYDVYSFAGAIRKGVEKLQEAYPEAQILLMTPNISAQYNFGKDKTTEQGGTLEEYAQVLYQLAEELGVEILDNFKELPIDEKNWSTYIPDGTHLNEMARFWVGSRIAQRIRVQE